MNSDSFEEKAGHENPSLRFASLSQVTDQARLGILHLQSELLERRLNAWKDLPIDMNQALAKFDETTKRYFKAEGNGLYYGERAGDPSGPQIGPSHSL